MATQVLTQNKCVDCGQYFETARNLQLVCTDCFYEQRPFLLDPNSYTNSKIKYEYVLPVKPERDFTPGSKQSKPLLADVAKQPEPKPVKQKKETVKLPEPVKHNPLCDGTSRFCSLESALRWREKMALKAPMSYFGKKDKIAPEIWRLAGDVKTYIEPFGGTLAVLRLRPNPKGREIVNDGDCLLVNAWRAIKYAPDKVASEIDAILYAEVELNARRQFLKDNRDQLLEKVSDNSEYFDLELAADYFWCASAAIGGAKTINSPSKRSGGIVSHPNNGVFQEGRSEKFLQEWFRELSARLKSVTIMCRDAKEILTAGYYLEKEYLAPHFVFVDPPYATGEKYMYYTNELCDWLQDWCIENGNATKIILAGYSDDYHKPFPQDWQIQTWKQGIGFATGAKDLEAAKEKQGTETLWISPACVRNQGNQFSMGLA